MAAVEGKAVGFVAQLDLLQIDTDDSLDMMWADGGLLYFWIREEDALNATSEMCG